MSRPDQEGASPPSRILDAQTLLFLLGALLFLYAYLFTPPFIPIDHGGDGAIYEADGMRMYQGEVMYRDFFQFSTPGTALVYALSFKLLGCRLWIPNLALLLLGLGLAGLGVVIARKFMRPRLALLPSAIFLTGLYRNHLDPTHHWFSLLPVMGALAVLMERRTPPRILASGFLCGLAVCFTQSRGLAAIVGFAAFLWWESSRKQEGGRALLKKETLLIAGFFAALIAVNSYFVWKAGLTRFLWCTVVFGAKYYPQDANWNTFKVIRYGIPEFGSLPGFIINLGQWFFVTFFIPLTCVLFFIRYGKEAHKKPTEFWARPMLLAMVGSCMLLSVAPAPALSRVAPSALPGILLLGWFLDSPSKLPRTLAALFSGGALLVALHAVVVVESPQRWILTTPQGQVALANHEDYEAYTWVQQHTRPSDYLYNASWPFMYFYLGLRNPTPLPFVVNNGYTPSEQVAEVIRGLEQHQVRYIVCSPTDPEWRANGEDPSDDHLGPLRDYLHDHYRAVKIIPDYREIWERVN